MPSPITYETATYAVRDRTAIITLNRPARLNAIVPQLRLDVVRAFREADSDDDVQSQSSSRALDADSAPDATSRRPRTRLAAK